MTVKITNNGLGNITLNHSSTIKITFNSGVNEISDELFGQLEKDKYFNWYESKDVLQVYKEELTPEPSHIALEQDKEKSTEGVTILTLDDNIKILEPDWESITEENYTKEELDEYANTFGINLNSTHKFTTMLRKFKDKYSKKE